MWEKMAISNARPDIWRKKGIVERRKDKEEEEEEKMKGRRRNAYINGWIKSCASDADINTAAAFDWTQFRKPYPFWDRSHKGIRSHMYVSSSINCVYHIYNLTKHIHLTNAQEILFFFEITNLSPVNSL